MKFWIPGPQRAYGTTPRGFQGEIQVVRASDYDLVAHANKVQAEEIHALRKALAQSTILNGSDFVLAYPGCPDCWRVKPEDMPARAAVQQPAPQPAAALVRIKRRMKELWETVPTRADPGSYYLGRSTGTADTLRAIQEEIDRAADQQPAPQPDARLAEAERLILRMSGEGFQRAKFYVDKYDLTGERAADQQDAP